MEPQPPPIIQPAQKCGPATASLVLGILTYVIGGLFTAIPAVICGHIARREIKNNPTLTGNGKAIAGLILGYFAIAVTALVLAFFIFFISRPDIPDVTSEARLGEMDAVPAREAEFLVVLPSDHDPVNPIPVAIWLHGHGASPKKISRDRANYQKRADNLGIAFVAISGYGATDDGGYEWSEIADIDRRYLLDVLDEHSDKLNPDWPNVALLGFSQGGKVAGEVAASDPERFKGAIMFSPSREINRMDMPEESRRGHSNQTYFCFVGAGESLGNVLLAETYANRLRRLGANIEHEAIEDIYDHSLPADYNEKISEWLKEILN